MIRIEFASCTLVALMLLIPVLRERLADWLEGFQLTSPLAGVVRALRIGDLVTIRGGLSRRSGEILGRPGNGLERRRWSLVWDDCWKFSPRIGATATSLHGVRAQPSLWSNLD